jgi:ferredoxin-NADP reductase
MFTETQSLSYAATRVLDPQWVDFVLGHFSRTLRLTKVMATVEAVHDETPDIKSFSVRPNANFRGFTPGQFIPVRVTLGGIVHERYYSLTGEPDAPALEFAVKRQPGGKVSNHLHDHVRAGDVIEIGQAGGEFTLPAAHPEKLLLIAGGSGVTPVYALATAALRAKLNADVTLLYYARTESDFALADRLHDLTVGCPGLTVHLIAENADLRFSGKQLAARVPDYAARETYLCGPAGLMQAVAGHYRSKGLTARLHLESFGPPLDAAGPAAAVPVQFRRSQKTVSNAQPNLLATAEAAGLKPASGCRMGICHTCTCTKVSGIVRDKVTGQVDDRPGSRIRLCVSEPLGPVTLEL